MDEKMQFWRTDGAKERALDPQKILKGLAYIAGAAVLGSAELPFGAFPFGFAALGASGLHTVSVFAGLCLSLIGRRQPFAYAVAYALTLVLRAAVSLMLDEKRKGARGLFREHVSVRCVICATGAFGIGMYRLLRSGFLYYDLFGAIICITVSAVAVALMHSVERSDAGQVYRTLGRTVLLCALTWGLRDTGIYGISAAVLFASVCSLYITRKKGLVMGSFTALSVGMCVSVGYAPLFVFGVVAYGLLSSVTPFFGAVASLGVGMAWGIYLDGIAAVGRLLPALLLANFIFLTLDRLYFSQTETETVAEPEAVTPDRIDTGDVSLARLNGVAGRLKLLCEGLGELSDMLVRVDVARAEELASYEVGELYSQEREGYFDCAQRSFVMASELRAISEYIAGIMVENSQDYVPDAALGREASEALSSVLGGACVAVSVFGDVNKRVMVCCDDGELLRRSRELIRRTVARACGIPLDEGELSETDGRSFLLFCRASVLKVSFAGKKRNCIGEDDFCGDSFGVISEERRTFAFISDGMGSGREAAETSGLCALFLQKLLPITDHSKCSITATLKALNSFIRHRNSGPRECAATVDLAVLDTARCRASFYKSGAAPTYVFRDGSLFKVRSRTAPIGIIRDTDVGEVSMELLPGDVIIMVSDGVTQGKEECRGLFDLLRTRVLTHSAEQLADAVIEYADGQGSVDDVSAVVIKVSEADIPIL